jgi:hypothetical protein
MGIGTNDLIPFDDYEDNNINTGATPHNIPEQDEEADESGVAEQVVYKEVCNDIKEQIKNVAQKEAEQEEADLVWDVYKQSLGDDIEEEMQLPDNQLLIDIDETLQSLADQYDIQKLQSELQVQLNDANIIVTQVIACPEDFNVVLGNANENNETTFIPLKLESYDNDLATDPANRYLGGVFIIKHKGLVEKIIFVDCEKKYSDMILTPIKMFFKGIDIEKVESIEQAISMLDNDNKVVNKAGFK